MGLGMQYNPNRPDELHRAWEEHCGVGDKSANGWVFLDDERIVLDMIVTDSDGEWLFGERPSESGSNGWDVLAHHAAKLNATNIISIHHHKNEDAIGPCAELEDFASSGSLAFDGTDIQLRAVIVCTESRLDGVLQVQKLNAKNVMATMLLEGVRLRTQFSARTDIPDEDRDVIVAAIDNTLASMVGSEPADPDLLRRAAQIAARHAEAHGIEVPDFLRNEEFSNLGLSEPKSKPQPADPFSLPSINVADIKYMN